MSGLSRIVSSLSCVFVLSSFIGCATFHSPFDHKKMPKATAADPVVDIVCLWSPGEGSDPDGVPCKGFQGQILFLQQSSSTPVQIEGDVRVYLFDDQGTVEEQSKPLRQFDFDNGSWGIHLADSSFGPTYSVFIPYVRRGVTNAACSLRVRLKPKQGPIVFSEFSNMALNGHKKSTTTEDAKPITKEEVDRMTVDAFSGSLRRTTTISTGTNPQTEQVAPVVKKDASPNQVQLASHEVVSDPSKESAEADRIRRLESMVEKLLEQKANSGPAATSSTQPRRNTLPVETDQASDDVRPASESPTTSRRIKVRRNGDEATISKPSTRRPHPLDDDQRTRSRRMSDDEMEDEPSFSDATDSNMETTYLPRDSNRNPRYQRSSR